MKTIKAHALILLFTIPIFACNNKDNKTDATQNSAIEKNETAKKIAAITSPCDLVSMEDVKRMFAITEYPIEMKDVVYTYPTCIYRWEDGKITSSVTIAGQEIISKLPSEVLIVMVKNVNEAMFKRSTSVYKQPEEIPNIGTRAVWDAKMSQLTVLSNSYMFHVHVKVSSNVAENKEKAIEVAQLIIKKIK